MRPFVIFAMLLLVVGLGCQASGSAPEPAPIQGPQLPATCSTEGYEHLPQGDILVAEMEGRELAELSWENGMLTIVSGGQQNSAPLAEGPHYMTFVLVDGETPIAQAQLEVNICNGEFYYRAINITPFQSQDA